MTFEFLVACCMMPETNIGGALTELLSGILLDYNNEFDEDTITSMIQLRCQRRGEEFTDENGVTNCRTLIGFTIELPDETESKAEAINAFAKSLPETPPIFHALKFEDPLLQAELAQHATEIFGLEMKLRRVLSLIYLHAYQRESLSTYFEMRKNSHRQERNRHGTRCKRYMRINSFI